MSETQPLLMSKPSTSTASSPSTRRALRLRDSLRQPLAEFLGTALIVFIGDGVVAQTVLSKGAFGGWLHINLAWAGGVMLASLVAGSVSGAHLNPAVTIALAAFKREGARFPLRKVPGYILAQMLGGFAGAALVFAEYWREIDLYEAGGRSVPGGRINKHGQGPTAGIFCTYPLHPSSWATSFFSEFLAAALLMLGIFAITSSRNSGTRDSSAHFSVFVLILCIGCSVGWQTGYAINAARDLSPRIFTYFVYGSEVFTSGGHYWWIPVIAPVAGTLAGAAIFELLIGEPDGVIEGLMGGLPVSSEDQDERAVAI